MHRPLVPSPGQWLQYDFGDGPVVAGQKTILFVAYLPWSKARFVPPMLDKTLPSVVTVPDRALRYFPEVPEVIQADNEKTVTVDNVCSSGAQCQDCLYGPVLQVLRFIRANLDRATKGGAHASVKLAKADLVPKNTNLLGEYESFAAQGAPCQTPADGINAREARLGARCHKSALVPKKERFHPLPERPYPLAVGQERRVGVKTQYG